MREHVNYWIEKGSKECQNCDSKILELKSFVQKDGNTERKCKEAMFKKIINNGDTIDRSSLCFSPTTGRTYCFYCKLFGAMKSQFTQDGYCDWKNAHRRFTEHEQSQCHLNAVYNFTLRASEKGLVDVSLKNKKEEEKNYWKSVLKRVIGVIIFLSERNLPFRGDNEILGVPNNSNFLGIIEFLSNYDDFLLAHLIKYGQCGTGHVNYLSCTIYDELIEIISHKLLNTIIENIRKSRYYSLSVDSTTDVGHVDQLCLVMRCMENHRPIERFLMYFPKTGHTAKNMFDVIKGFLEEQNLDIKNCRGQSYDNASSMSGHSNGLQAQIK